MPLWIAAVRIQNPEQPEPVLQSLAKLILRAGGWTAVGNMRDVPKAVVIAAPHTSNWDGFWALAYTVAVGADIHLFAKHSLFWFPFGALLRSLGGIPLDRSHAGGAVQQAVEMFNESDCFYFGLAPEGSRKKTPGWKSGFYRIAERANVPVYLGFLDYKHKRLGIGRRLDLSGDQEADLQVCRDFYADVEGRWPEQTSPIQFAQDTSAMETRSPNSQRRTIRSFVRRTGRLTPSQQRALVELWPSYGVDVGAAKLDFDMLFSKSAAVVLEIGFGNGDTLVQQAHENPAWNFVGIEVHEPGVGHCLLQARDSGLTNLKLIKHDALDVLRYQIPSESLQRVNIYFPDPWPKKRHHKRRMIQTEFLDLLGSRLKSAGAVHIATDWANYAEHIDAVVEQSVIFTCNERREHDGSDPLDRPRTKFEQRGLQKGHRIWDWRITKHRHNY